MRSISARLGGGRRWAWVAAAVVSAAGCGGDDTATPAGPGGGGKGGQAGTAGSGGGAGQGGAGQGGAAGSAGGLLGGGGGAAGQATCPKDCQGQCVGSVCCAPLQTCGSVCCGGEQVCSFGQCVAPGVSCRTSFDCGDGSYCDGRLGPAAGSAGQGGGGTAGAGTAGAGAGAGTAGAGGAGAGAAGAGGECSQTGPTGRCLPRPPVCAGGQSPPPDQPLTCVGSCQVKPAFAELTPKLSYQWGGQVTSPWATDVMMTPLVIQLDDDDCDGQITARDTPEIVLSTYSGGDYTNNGTLRALSVSGGQLVERWSTFGVFPGKSLAAGNIDGLPGNEIVACLTGDPPTLGGGVGAYEGATGKLLWSVPGVSCGYPALADLDHDGKPEVIVETGIYEGATGAQKAVFDPPFEGTFAVSDLDGDGQPDIVTNQGAYHADGKRFVATGLSGFGYPGYGAYFQAGPAVADLDGDGKPEVIMALFNQHALGIWRYDPQAPSGVTFVRTSVDLNGTLDASLCPAGSAGSKWGGGPVTVGDFNGDGTPDVALAGGVGYAVFDGKKLIDPAVAPADTFLWVKKTQDCSSAGTGSSLFDFDGDGKAEVVYADERTLHIYEGATGDVLFETCNTSGTISEYPVIADVDGDDRADIVVVANASFSGNPAYACDDGAGLSGVRVFSDQRWVRTRRVWNQDSYHVTNVEEDGTIPATEATNWTQPGLNNFRQNKQPGSEFAAPDVVVSLVAPVCAGTYGLVATVRNVGESVLPAGVRVGFYAGDAPGGTLLGSRDTTVALAPAQAQDLTLSLPAGSGSLGASKVYAVADDGGPPHTWVECRTDNNTSTAISPVCGAVID